MNESIVGAVDESVEAVTWAKGGSKAGFLQLYSFLHHRLHAYAQNRNDPTKDALSNISPWFHFGKRQSLLKFFYYIIHLIVLPCA